MDNQPVPASAPTPDASPARPSLLVGNPDPVGPPGTKNNVMMIALIAVLGLGSLIFGVMAVVSYNTASVATKTLKAQTADSAAKAKIEQKKADDEANTIASESPFRSYFAPIQYGSFEIKFPKNWSGYADQEKTGTQVALVLNPDFIRRTNSEDELAAARITLIERPVAEYLTTFSSQLKRGTVKQSDLTVSELKAIDLSGQFQDKKATRVVVVPVRDKVLVFVNENVKYATEFNEILAQSKIIP